MNPGKSLCNRRFTRREGCELTQNRHQRSARGCGGDFHARAGGGVRASLRQLPRSGRILVCRDTRASGRGSSRRGSGLLASGCEIVDLGVCRTPSLQLAVPWLGAEGRHLDHRRTQPEPWNALKFVRADGLYLNATQADELSTSSIRPNSPRPTGDAAEQRRAR